MRVSSRAVAGELVVVAEPVVPVELVGPAARGGQEGPAVPVA
jgi:hypothetical protein